MSVNIDYSQLVTSEQRERSKIAKRRWEAEVGGLSLGGMHIHTDRDSRTNILGAYQEALEDPAFVVNWKAADGGFIALGREQIFAVAKAIRAHVQACFDREMELLASLEAGETYDVEAGWPSGVE